MRFRTGTFALALLTASMPLVVSHAAPREPTFEERIAAQSAIERVYYAHQVGERRPFDEVASRERLERKVRTYIEQSVALDQIWHDPLTGEALAREWERIARASQFPDRLREIYRALGNDPFVIQECLVRPELADHLARGRFAYDSRIHAAARVEAESLRDSLVRGAIDPRAGHPRRIVEPLADAPDAARRGLGEIGLVEESRESFEVRVRGEGVKYVFEKETWDEWWAQARKSLDLERFRAVAGDERPPSVMQAGAGLGPECTPNTWRAGGLDDLPGARGGHLAFWTGSLMLVFGRPENQPPGNRYDPLIDRWTSITPTGAPTSFNPTYVGVWTGSEMIVWNTAVGIGGRYDPVTDTWIALAAGGPVVASGAKAVWTGSEMVVWGGRLDSVNYTNAGARYTAATNTWTATTTVGAPTGRGDHTAVWTGSEMIVWGGITFSNNTFTNTGGRYNPALNQWTPTTTVGAPAARVAHVAVWANGEMIVHGGALIYSGNAVATGGRYDPTSDSWTATPTTGSPSRALHTAVWTGSKMIVWGGGTNHLGGTAQNTGAGYDPATGWSGISSVGEPSARIGHSAVWTGTRMLIWGGEGTASKGYTGAQYVASTDSWIPMTTIAPREDHTAVWTGNEMIVWGGVTLGVGVIRTGARYDPLLASWSETTTLGAPTARFGHYAVWTGDEMIVWGGSGGDSGARYDPTADAWQPMSLPGFSGLAGSSAAVVWSGTEMIAWGGPQAYGGRYNPQNDTWTQTAPFTQATPRNQPVGVWTGHDMIVWGGGQFSDGGRYDPVTDSWFYIWVGPNSPVPRSDQTAVWTGHLFLVFGGQVTGSSDLGGAYDAQTFIWSAISMANGPTRSSGHTAIWTGGRMIAWGVRIPLDSLTPTPGGIYDPVQNSWLAMTTADAPADRHDHTAVWTGRSMFVWGGANYLGGPDNDGAEYFPDSDADGLSDACDNCAIVANAGQEDQDGDGIGDACDACPATPDADLDLDGTTTCTDCDDSSVYIYPGAPARCDGVNNDCDDPSWPSVAGTPDADTDGDTWLVCEGDCNDGSAVVHPGATEICNGADEDCDALIDEDELGVDTDADGIRNACDNCRSVANPSQVDADGDDVGNSCDNCLTVPNPDQQDPDADARGNACDNCPFDANPAQDDLDADRVGDACDNCLFDPNPVQTDMNHDAEGDLCDFDDGLIYILFNDPALVEWQQEAGFSTWNSYRGSLAVLTASGVYTQAPGSNPLAQRDCGLTSPSDPESIVPGVGEVAFWIVTGENGSVESGLGTNSVGVPRPNANPCP